jgi:hypothetical protein
VPRMRSRHVRRIPEDSRGRAVPICVGASSPLLFSEGPFDSRSRSRGRRGTSVRSTPRPAGSDWRRDADKPM